MIGLAVRTLSSVLGVRIDSKTLAVRRPPAVVLRFSSLALMSSSADCFVCRSASRSWRFTFGMDSSASSWLISVAVSIPLMRPIPAEIDIRQLPGGRCRDPRATPARRGPRDAGPAGPLPTPRASAGRHVSRFAPPGGPARQLRGLGTEGCARDQACVSSIANRGPRRRRTAAMLKRLRSAVWRRNFDVGCASAHKGQ